MEVEVQDQGALSAERPMLHHSITEQTEKTRDKQGVTSLYYPPWLQKQTPSFVKLIPLNSLATPL